MTREEAIKMLKSKIDGHTDTSYEWTEAVRMAINALEQESTTKNDLLDCQCTDEEIAKSFIEDVEAVKDLLPTTKNDLGVDCISRSEVLNRLANIAKIKAKSDAQKSLMGRCMFMIECISSVTLQEPRPSAKWISLKDEYGDIVESVCSNCKTNGVHTWKFCRECGAQMVEPQESED